jgi:hypothetical protein
MFVLVKNAIVKWKCETVRCRVATACSFVVKVRGEVFVHFRAVVLERQIVCGTDWPARANSL